MAVMSEGELVCVSSPRELFSNRELIEKHGIELPRVTAIASALPLAG
ncbi:MAG: hypothetical protein ACLUSP_09470 [Christensenellales bacterium]